MVRKAALQETNRKDSTRNEGHFLRCRERGDGKQSGIWQQQRWSYDLRRSETTMCLSQKRSLIQYSSCKMKECKWRFFRAEITDARTSKRWTVWKCHWQIWWIHLLRPNNFSLLILPFSSPLLHFSKQPSLFLRVSLSLAFKQACSKHSKSVWGENQLPKWK